MATMFRPAAPSVESPLVEGMSDSFTKPIERKKALGIMDSDAKKKMKGFGLMMSPMATESEDESEADDAGDSVFDEYADDAFAAAKSGDKAGFRTALKSAIEACHKGGSYGDDSDDSEEV